jgi:hypothetical protein
MIHVFTARLAMVYVHNHQILQLPYFTKCTKQKAIWAYYGGLALYLPTATSLWQHLGDNTWARAI